MEEADSRWVTATALISPTACSSLCAPSPTSKRRPASRAPNALLENKLAWVPASIDTILAGGEPKELVVKLRRQSPEPGYRFFTSDALSRACTEELLLELRRRIVRPRDRRRESWHDWDGLDSRGDWPDAGELQGENRTNHHAVEER